MDGNAAVHKFWRDGSTILSGMKDLRVHKGRWQWLAGAALCGAVACPGLVLAQTTTSIARPVVQSVPSSDSQRLNAALARLGRNPRDFSALLDAGDAARSSGDFDAAIGFYRRADEVAPGDVRVKAGLGSAFVMTGDPVTAIPYFADAERAGAAPSLIASDRGLAYDLVGDNAAAQRLYQSALIGASGPALDTVRMRLAVSQAIAGDLATANTTLMPLLSRQDKPGWRTRAFTLAIGGQTDEAVDTVNKILPGRLAQNIAPYLRYMPRLTRAQQAAAANLGRFPRASEIGHDDPRLAAFAPPRLASADSGLIPRGEPLDSGKGGKPAKSSSRRSAKPQVARVASADPARLANDLSARSATHTSSSGLKRTQVAGVDPDRVLPPEPMPTIETSGELPPVGRTPTVAASTPAIRSVPPGPMPITTPPSSAPVTRTSTSTASAFTSIPPLPSTAQSPSRSATTPAANRAAPRPGFDLARLPASQPISQPPAAAAPSPTPAATMPASPAITLPAVSTLAVATTPPAPSPVVRTPATAVPPPVLGPGQRSLSEIFADLGAPTVEVVPASGAVDIRAIAAHPPAKAALAVAPTANVSKISNPQDASLKADPKLNKAAGLGARDAKGKLLAEEDAGPSDKVAKTRSDEKPKVKKPAPPAHPSRIWVQIGVGRDKDAIAFDWRRYVKQAPALFKGRTAWISDMGRTNRILAGPFETMKAANAFVADLKKAGLDGVLPWTSPAGQVVDQLAAR